MNSSTFSTYDVSNFPKVKVLLIGNIDNDTEFEQFKQGWLDCYLNHDNTPFTFIFDTRQMGYVSVVYAFKMSQFIKEIKKSKNKLLQKSIIIVSHRYINMLLNMIFYIEKPIAPVYIVNCPNYAEQLYDTLKLGSSMFDSTKASLVEP